MRASVRLAASFLLALVLPGAAPAQEKSLHWAELAVHARIDAAGVLHVEERHAMVFTGDWNGGERRFNLRLGQHLDLQSLRRIEPATGSAIPLVEGDLAQVDHYAWAGNSTLRWRSRLPSDPPFQGTTLQYVLDYTLSGVLAKSGGQYHLWHDFAFPERSGEIQRFSLDLAFDPVWRPLTEVPGHLERQNLSPGESVLVKADLAYQGAAEDQLAGIPVATPISLRAALFAAALLAMIVLLLGFRRSEGALGRFTPPAVPTDWDEAWLRDNVFLYRPEEVGALWDRTTGAPEVAAVLARLVGEGKLASRVENRRLLGLFSQDILHLTLQRDREDFDGYEGKLIDKLFFDGRTETDTEAVRKRYRSSGFDPAAAIRPSLENRLLSHAELQGVIHPRNGRRTLALFLATLALIVLDGLAHGPQGPVLAAIVALGVAALYVGGVIAAFAWRKRTEAVEAAALTFLLPGLGIFALCLLASFFGDWFPVRFFLRPGLFGDLALALLPVATWSSLLNNARSRETAPALHRRQLLAAGRRMFERELKQRQPRLRDEWLPYLLAFGLFHEVDRWFRAFGAAGASAGLSAAASSSSSSFSGSGGGGWTGGGGSFGGAGSSASWAAAATGLAAGVSAPSSSGGGGGGGGGGSSGGGGGGGW
jgi:uncharacterized membrane protein YgcG